MSIIILFFHISYKFQIVILFIYLLISLPSIPHLILCWNVGSMMDLNCFFHNYIFCALKKNVPNTIQRFSWKRIRTEAKVMEETRITMLLALKMEGGIRTEKWRQPLEAEKVEVGLLSRRKVHLPTPWF